MKAPKMLVVDEQPVSELPEEYKPSPWITDTNPRRSPYVPQMGDEVMYFWQGHKAYVEAVKRHNVYVIDGRKFPWNHLDLKVRIETCHQHWLFVLLFCAKMVFIEWMDW